MDNTATSTTISEGLRASFAGDHEVLDQEKAMSLFTMCSRSWENHSRSKRREAPVVKPSRRPPRSRRKFWIAPPPNILSPHLLVFLLLSFFTSFTQAVFINFENCLDPGIVQSDPLQLQFIPLYFSARFNRTAPSHNLNITIYGNVSGQATVGTYPPPDDKSWSDPKITFGKIVDVSPSNNKYATLFSTFKVLTYTPYAAPASQFCLSTVNTSCPIAPAFSANASDPYSLPAFTVGHDFFSLYSFATLASTVRVDSGDNGAPHLACVSANITPDLGQKLSDTLTYLPAAVLALVAIATVLAAMFSPWGTVDPFHWTSNYGRDEDLLRLVTPGFGDCLQYIQFIVLAGSLNLNYPGFYQPVVSQASWSVLLFNESFVSHQNGTQSLVDGIYFVNGTYGLSRLGQLVGMSMEEDIWAGMAVWLLGITLAVVLLCQLGFMIRWSHRQIRHSQQRDLRSLNWPFTAGNIVRIFFNYFLLPIIAFSMFQLVVAYHSPASVVAMAVALLVGVMGFAAWIFWLIFTTRPRAHLFDDLPTVLTYGPLYNTYSDEAAPFAFIPILLTCIRGVAIGAIQPSGIAQIVLLAICEVILILTLNAFRPFQANTSMNAYHTFFSVIRLVTTCLSIAFVPSLDVSESAKGWLGYAILLLHAIVLVFGFFLNGLQTIIEVVARAVGAGGETRGGLTRVFGMRQLSRRTHRRNQRSSLNSDAAMLSAEGDSKSVQLMGSRTRSLSASSAVLLNQPLTGSQQASLGFDKFSQGGEYSNFGGTSPVPGTPGSATPFTYLPGGSGSGSTGSASRRPTLALGTNAEAVDPYYRPPRARRPTIDPYTPGARSKGSTASADLANIPYQDSPEQAEDRDSGEGSSSFSPPRGSIAPAYLRMHRDDSDPNLSERRKQTDYTVRESDYYYGIRGPALSNLQTRKLKTGPADPMGPVSSATGWFKTLFGGKGKEKGKGFEVVRSTRMPPQMMPLDEDEESPPVHHEPYHDSPDGPSSAAVNAAPSEDGGNAARGVSEVTGEPGPLIMDDMESYRSSHDDPFEHRMNRISDIPPMLGPIDTLGGIELPSRIGSRASSKPSRAGTVNRAPTIPRKSSRRTNSRDELPMVDVTHLSTVAGFPPDTPGKMSTIPPMPVAQHLRPDNLPVRLPFGSSELSPSPERTPGHSAASSIYPMGEAAMDPGHRRGSLVPPQSMNQPDRPLSTGYVHHRLASDSIQANAYDMSSHLERAAELVDARRKSISTNRSDVTH